MIRVWVAAIVGLLLTSALGCRDESTLTQQALDAERNRRVQAEQQATESEKRKEGWRTAATGAAAGAFVLLVIGAALGSKAKRDVGR